MNATDLLRPTEHGLYCEAGDFHVDPWRPVPRAVVTHAHADHACWGCGRYLTSSEGERVLRVRMGREAVDRLRSAYGEAVDIGGVRVSLHPAGHILGSSQVRLEHRGEVWVVSGDYKVEPDATCTAVRAGPLPHVRHRVDLRPADLSMAVAAERLRRDQRLVAGQPRGGQGEPAPGVRAGQVAAAALGARPVDRADLHARGGREAEPGLSRGRHRPAADLLRRGGRQGEELGRGR